MKVAVGSSSFGSASDDAMNLLKSHGIEVVKNPYGRKLTEDETIEHLKGAAGLLAGLEPLTERVFAASPALKAVARIGIGMDSVDIEAAKRHGVAVSNTPDGPTEAVAEMTLSAMLALIHQLPALDHDVHSGVWKKRLGRSISGLKVFIIGYGRIGRAVAALLKNMGAEVKAYDKYQEGVSDCTLDEGLTWADAVTLHVSGTDEVIGARELAMMGSDAYLLNSARGTVVNEDALYDALQNNRIAGYWGDALWQEPYTGKIVKCQNAILTPHICTYTTKCRQSMEMQATKNLLRDLGME